jgi:Carboxypeptidase regulatory-like domain/Chitobiase/beta-hexosaminidase C-terminal domain
MVSVSILLSSLLICTLICTEAIAWTIQTADSKPTYSTSSTRTLRIDKSTNIPHMAFGGDYLYHAYFDGTKWIIETVDKTSNVGSYASLALDSSGRQHISYYDSANGELRYATNALGSWMTIVLDVGNVGMFSAIAVDSNGKAHISYWDAVNKNVKYATNSAGNWEVSLLDSTGTASNGYSSIAVDASNKVHVAYSSSSTLKYANNSTGFWSIQTADSVGAGFPSLVIDSSGKAHIAYNVSAIKGVKYATNKDGSWVAVAVATHPTDRWFGFGTSIDLDSTGAAHITWYQSLLTNGVFHAKRQDDGTWVWGQVATGAAWFAGDHSSVAIDNNDSVHITHYSTNTYNFMYSTNSSGSWGTSTISIAGYTGQFSALAVDNSIRAHIVHYDRETALNFTSNSAGWVSRQVGTTGSSYSSIAIDSSSHDHISYSSGNALTYLTNASGDWISEIVDPATPNVGGDHSSIALDSAGNAHISYYDAVNQSLKYATNASGIWITTTADKPPATSVGTYTSIAVDSSGTVHISYFDATNGDLKYAKKVSGGAWTVETLDSTGIVGLYSSLALDPANKVHISYYDSTNLDLKYITNASGVWVPMTVDAAGDVGQYSSLKVSSVGKVHIAYYDATNGDLKYATNSSGSWVLSTLDSYGTVGLYSRLVLDKNQRVHISYYDSSNRDLKYATNAAIDITPPGGTFFINSGAYYANSSTVTLSPSCMDLQSSCISMQFSNDGVFWPPPISYSATTSWTIPGGNGLKTVYARYMDSWGNWSNSLISSITLDISPPAGGITVNSGDSLTNSRNVTLNLTCSDIGGSGCVQMQFSNDGIIWENSVNNTSYPALSFWQLAAGADGNRNVYARFKDAAGNQSVPVMASTTLDTTPPGIPAVTGTTPTNTLTPTWNWTSGGGGITLTPSYRYKLDDPTMTSPTVTSSTSFTSATLTPGTHTLFVQEQDAAGNWSAAGSFAIVIDTTAPNAPVVSGSSLSNNSRPTWTWASGGGGGNDVYRARVDNSDLSTGAFTPTGTSHSPATALNEGNHTLYVQERDAAGNWSTSGSYTTTVDSTAPTTSVSSPTSTINLSNATDVYLSCADGSGIGCAGTWYTVNGTTPTESSTPYNGTPIGFSGLTSPVYLKFFSVDSLGNKEAPKTVTVSFIAGYTTLTLDLASPTLLQNGLLDVSGKLTRYPDSVDIPNNGMNLSNLPVRLTITGPAGSPCEGGCVENTTTYSSLGHYRFQGLDRFSFKGNYTLRAHFTATGLHQASDSAVESLLVGASAGYAIIVEGKINTEEGLASHNKTTGRVYEALKERGFVDDNIMYYNYAGTMVPGVDAVPTKSAIQSAIQNWAKDRMNGAPAPLYVIFVDHGSSNTFYIYPDTISPAELNSWLGALETGLSTAAKLEKRVVILGMCYSGSFLNTLSQAPVPGVNAGRVVIASAAADEQSYKGPNEPDDIRSGEFFIEELFKQLKKGASFKAAFVEAAALTRTFTSQGSGSANSNNTYNDNAVQHPLLEDDGIGTGSNSLVDGMGDGVESAAMHLGFGVTNASLGPADLKGVSATHYLGSGTSSTPTPLWAEAYSNAAVSSAWFEVKAPSTVLAGTGGTGQLALDIPKVLMELKVTGKWEPVAGADPVFTTAGKYEVYYFTKSTNAEISEMKRSLVYKNYPGNLLPATFNLVSPGAGGLTEKTRTTLNLVWQGTTDADGLTYTVQIATDNLFTDIVFQKEEIAHTWYYIDESAALKDKAVFYWRVLAVDTFGATRPSNQVWSFETDDTNAIPGQIRGYVNDALSNPVVGATVTAALNGNVVAQTSSGAGGAFVFVVPPGGYNLNATASGYTAGASGPFTLASGGVQNSTVFITITNPNLQVTLTGSGSGTVSSDTGGIACLSGSPANCSAPYANGTLVTMTATPDWKSLFGGWSNAYTGMTNPVGITMNANKTLSAAFTLNLQARVGGTDYASLQTAYDNAATIDGSTIKARVYTFLEPNLLFIQNKTVTIDGGWNSDYSLQTGFTTIDGKLTIRQGTLKVREVVVK